MIDANPVGIEYLVRNERMRADHTNKIPDKRVEMARMPWGLFGYTYLGEGKQWLNELLYQTPDFKREVDLHEAIHTNDEYETRVVSKDMLREESRAEILKRIMDEWDYRRN